MTSITFPGGGGTTGAAASAIILPPDTLANRPAASTAGRLFYSTDFERWYRDNGTTWVYLPILGDGDLADPGANGIVVRTAAGTTTARVLTAASGKLLVTNASGVAGAPTVDLGSVASTDLTDTATLLHVAAIGTTVQGYSSGLDSLKTAYAGVKVPKHSLDWARGPQRPMSTRVTASVATTDARITVASANLLRAGIPETVGIIDANGTVEEAVCIDGQGTTTLTLMRFNPVTHSAGARVVTRGWINWLVAGDSTISGDTNDYDSAVSMLRRIAESRFGGALGLGFYGLYRNATDSAAAFAPEWTLTGSWTASLSTAIYDPGVWLTRFGAASSSNIAQFAVPGEGNLAAADILWMMSRSAGNAWSWAYSYDNGVTFGNVSGGIFVASTWVNNPNASSYPTATTTLNVADNGRSLSYWDGTKTMTIASTTGYPTAGYFRLTTTGGTATFSYAGVTSGTVLANVKLIRGSGSWTSATSQVVEIVPTLQKSRLTGFVDTSGIPINPTHIQVRAANAAGTGSVTGPILGIRLWSVIPVYGETTGIMVDNLGFDGHQLAQLVNTFTVDDLTITGTTTITGDTTSFNSSTTGQTIVGPGIPAGTTLTFVSTHVCTLSQACTNAANITCTFGGNGDTTGDWTRLFLGGPASLCPDLIIGQWTNDADLHLVNTGARAVTGSVTAGVLTLTVGTLNARDVGKVLGGTNVTAGTTIGTPTDSTHAPVTGTTTAASTAMTIGALEATINTGIANNLATFFAAITCGDHLLSLAFEQGTTRLDGTQCTSARQASYRAAADAWAVANGVAELNTYDAWVAEGITGYAQAVTAGYVYSGDLLGFHQALLGNRNQASRWSKELVAV